MIKKIQSSVVFIIAVLGLSIAILSLFPITVFPALQDSSVIASLTLFLMSVIALELVIDKYFTFNEIISELNKQKEQLNRIEEDYSQMNTFLIAFDQQSDFNDLAIRYGLRKAGRLFGNTIVVDQKHVFDLWRDCFVNENNWRAVSYALNVWGPNGPHTSYEDKMADEFQRWKISTGGNVQRIFIVDDENEAKALKNVMVNQKSYGVKVKWIMKKELLVDPLVKMYFEQNRLRDFALFEGNRMILQFNLDDNRRIEQASVIIDAEIISNARRLFNEANQGHEPEELP